MGLLLFLIKNYCFIGRVFQWTIYCFNLYYWDFCESETSEGVVNKWVIEMYIVIIIMMDDEDAEESVIKYCLD